MKKPFLCIFFAVIGWTVLYAAPQDVPAAISNAFEKARVPLLDKKQPIKDFNLTLLNGETVRLSALKGSVVFLNFWATWCPPCRAEMPSMENLYQRFRAQGMEVLAVNLGENKKDITKFMTANKLNFPVALDSNNNVSDAYGIRYIPTTFIIGRDGEIIISFTGSTEWDTPAMMAAFELLLDYK